MLIGRYGPTLLMLFSLFLINGCTTNQDDIDLPIFDAIGGNFTLPATTGDMLTLSNYQGKVVLINYGYTSCPDICPMVLTRIDKFSKQLEVRYAIGTEQLQTIFITVDPQRDTLPLLKEYLAFFNPSFVGVRGSKQQLSEITKNYAAYYEKQSEGDIDYQVAHTDSIYLLDKRGRLRALYSHADKDEKIIADIVSLTNAEI